MTPYLLMISFIIFGGLVFQPSVTIQRKKIFLWFSFLCMFMLSGLRDISVGTDTETYITLFNYIDSYNFSSSRYEKGFLYFLKAVHSISKSPSFLFFIVSGICIGTVCLLIYRYSKSPLLSVLLYITLKYYFFQMTGMRQALAIAFIGLAFLNIDKTQTKWSIIKSILFIIIACSIHSMSIVAVIPFALFIWPGVQWKILQSPTRIFKLTITISLFFFVFYGIAMKLVGLILPRYASYFMGTWSHSNYSAALFKMLVQLAFMFVGVLYLKGRELRKTESFFLIMMAFSVVTGTLSMKMTIWGRLTGTFSIYTILWASIFTETCRKRNNRIILKLNVFLLSLLYMVITFIYRPEWDGVVPYLLMK